MARIPKNDERLDELYKMIQQLTDDKGIHVFSKRDAAVLQKLVDRIHSLSPADQEKLHAILNKTTTLGRVIETFESIEGFIKTSSYIKNMSWLIVIVFGWIAYANGYLQTLGKLILGALK